MLEQRTETWWRRTREGKTEEVRLIWRVEQTMKRIMTTDHKTTIWITRKIKNKKLGKYMTQMTKFNRLNKNNGRINQQLIYSTNKIQTQIHTHLAKTRVVIYKSNLISLVIIYLKIRSLIGNIRLLNRISCTKSTCKVLNKLKMSYLKNWKVKITGKSREPISS